MPFTVGHTPWNKELNIQLTTDLSGLALGHQKGEENQNWKGEFASYSAIHYWLYRQLGKASFCSNDPTHGSPRFHWANISGEYKRDITDWKSLCPSCHYYFDNVGEKIWKTRKELI